MPTDQLIDKIAKLNNHEVKEALGSISILQGLFQDRMKKGYFKSRAVTKVTREILSLLNIFRQVDPALNITLDVEEIGKQIIDKFTEEIKEVNSKLTSLDDAVKPLSSKLDVLQEIRTTSEYQLEETRGNTINIDTILGKLSEVSNKVNTSYVFLTKETTSLLSTLDTLCGKFAELNPLFEKINELKVIEGKLDKIKNLGEKQLNQITTSEKRIIESVFDKISCVDINSTKNIDVLITEIKKTQFNLETLVNCIVELKSLFCEFDSLKIIEEKLNTKAEYEQIENLLKTFSYGINSQLQKVVDILNQVSIRSLDSDIIGSIKDNVSFIIETQEQWKNTLQGMVSSLQENNIELKNARTKLGQENASYMKEIKELKLVKRKILEKVAKCIHDLYVLKDLSLKEESNQNIKATISSILITAKNEFSPVGLYFIDQGQHFNEYDHVLEDSQNINSKSKPYYIDRFVIPGIGINQDNGNYDVIYPARVTIVEK